MAGDEPDYPDFHPNKAFKGELNTKANAANVINIISKLSPERLAIFSQTSFGYWVDVHKIKGDGLLIHGLFLREVLPDNDIKAHQRFRFRFGETELSFGREEFCLITGFRFGRLSDPETDIRIIPSTFRSRVFPKSTDSNLSVGELGDLIKDEVAFAKLEDTDAVRACLLYIALEGFIGKERKDTISRSWLSLVENIEDWNNFAWGSFLWTRTHTELSKVFEKIQARSMLIRKNLADKSFKMSVSGFTFPLTIWIWELFPGLHGKFCKRRDGVLLPRMRGWRRLKRVEWTNVVKEFEAAERGDDGHAPLPCLSLMNAESQAPYYLLLQDYLYCGAFRPIASPVRVLMPSPPRKRKKNRGKETESSSAPSSSNAHDSPHPHYVAHTSNHCVAAEALKQLQEQMNKIQNLLETNQVKNDGKSHHCVAKKFKRPTPSTTSTESLRLTESLRARRMPDDMKAAIDAKEKEVDVHRSNIQAARLAIDAKEEEIRTHTQWIKDTQREIKNAENWIRSARCQLVRDENELRVEIREMNGKQAWVDGEKKKFPYDLSE